MLARLRTLLLVSSLSFTGMCVAQNDPMATIPQGRMALTFNADLMSSLTTAGITVTTKGYSNSVKKGIGFEVANGTMDMANGVGEVASNGSLILSQGASVLTLRNFMLDTSAAQPFLSAVVVVNGRAMGRQMMFQLVSANPFAAPLQYGEYVTGTTYFKVAPAFTSEMNDYFAGTNFSGGQIIGSINLDVVLQVPAN